MVIDLTNLRLTDDARKSIAEQIYYLDEKIVDCRFEACRMVLSFSSAPARPEQLERQALELAARAAKSFAKVRTKVLFAIEGGATSTADPTPALRGSRQVVELFPGTFAYQGEFLRVMNRLDDVFRQLAISLGAVEQAYPTTVPLRSLVGNGYLAGFPQHLLVLSAVHTDLSQLEAAAQISADDPGFAGAVADTLGPPQQALSPTVCYHCFETLRSRRLAAAGVTFTAIGKCHRNEGHNLHSLARLQTFTMREIVYFGSPAFVQKRRQEITNHARQCFADWGVRCRLVTACDPFFAVAKENKRSFQSLMGLKHELQAFIPHDESWLSVASYNNHQSTLVDTYGITADDGSPLNSGCVGYGYERLAYALYSQFGNVVADWPKSLQPLMT